jgi:thiol-disulfide isomerase/thioredoxin
MNRSKQKGSILLVVIILIVLIGGGFLLISRDETKPKDKSASGDEMEKGAIMDDSYKGGIMEDGLITDEEIGSLEKMDDTKEMAFVGNVLAGDITPLINFNKADYERALEEKKLVVLYFYANWCPICKKEVSDALYPAFDELSNTDIVGFRVSYNDDETDSSEKDLAREFGVAYQHTKVFLKNKERVLKSPESWSKSRYLEEIGSVISNQ